MGALPDRTQLNTHLVHGFQRIAVLEQLGQLLFLTGLKAGGLLLQQLLGRPQETRLQGRAGANLIDFITPGAAQGAGVLRHHVIAVSHHSVQRIDICN